MLPLLLIVSFLSFALIYMMPGNYLTRAKMNPQFTKQSLHELEVYYGLNRPFLQQYWRWLELIVTKGDFGLSFDSRLPVFYTLFIGGGTGFVGSRLWWTLIISISTMVLTWLFAIPMGIYSATHQYKVSDHTLTFFGFLGLSIPNFFLALVLLWILVDVFHTGVYGLGVGGLLNNRFIGTPWTFAKFLNLLWHIWPAWVVIGTSGIAGLLRYMRGMLLDNLSLPYVQTARAKGLSERVVIYKHAVRNAINPLVSMLGMSLPGLVSGTLVSAIVLNLPTVERAFWQALQAQDQYVIMGGLLFFSLFLLVGNLLADILLAWVDPRIRY